MKKKNPARPDRQLHHHLIISCHTTGGDDDDNDDDEEDTLGGFTWSLLASVMLYNSCPVLPLKRCQDISAEGRESVLT